MDSDSSETPNPKELNEERRGIDRSYSQGDNGGELKRKSYLIDKT
jgi:hypothetical protein